MDSSHDKYEEWLGIMGNWHLAGNIFCTWRVAIFLYKKYHKIELFEAGGGIPPSKTQKQDMVQYPFPLTPKADLHLLREIALLHGLQFFIKMIIIIDTQTDNPESEVARP